VGCVSPFDFYTKFVVVTLVPLILLACIFLFCILPLYLLDK
jgi:hypothetical protein